MHIGSRHVSDEYLIRSLDGELAFDRRAGVAAHLAECLHCQERLAQFEGVSAQLANGRDGRDGAHLEGLARLRLSLEREVTTLGRHSERPSRWWRPSWATAAVVVLTAGAVATGVVPLATDTRHEGGIRPLTSLTPGATWHVTRDELCTGNAPLVRDIAEHVRGEVVSAYGMSLTHASEYELDYLITPELGGAPDRRNLWPQRYDAPVWNARVKDQLERLLPELVCGGHVDLATAQRDIAEDWIAAYRKYFHTDAPLPDARGEAGDEDMPVFAHLSEPYRLASGSPRRIRVITPHTAAFSLRATAPSRASSHWRPTALNLHGDRLLLLPRG